MIQYIQLNGDIGKQREKSSVCPADNQKTSGCFRGGSGKEDEKKGEEKSIERGEI